jgi:cytochrome c oxidase subunit II
VSARLLGGIAVALCASAAHAAERLQDALTPAGPQAAHIHELWWVMLITCGVVFVAVLGATAIALLRAPRGDAQSPPDFHAGYQREPRVERAIAVALVLSGAGLFGLLLASVLTDRALASLPLEGGVVIEVTARQWWWEAKYEDEQPARTFVTANELHVPVGRPVLVKLLSDDVIHSFWVPNLHGKKDLIPGRQATLQFRADRPGVYRGQCAEFCGFQHAKMAFLIIAEPPEEYERWAEAQRASAQQPTDATAKRGQEVFANSTCPMCHAIQGTDAQGRRAPDLTHVGSRHTLAAGALENTPTEMASWIANPQSTKPGVNMPAHPLPAADLQALVAYLGTLK